MSQITLLDGSIGQELVHRHGKKPTPLWSSFVMLEDPSKVRALHEDYYAAGATVATANSYPVLPDRMAENGVPEQLEPLLKAAGSAARAATDANGQGRVIGALGPLGASYRTDFTHGLADAEAGYGPVIGTLEPYVDVFLAETVTSLNQLRNTLHATATLSDKPTWIALSVDDDDGTRLRSGEALSDALPLLQAPHVTAALINCSRPEAVTQAMPILAQLGKAFGGYANGFVEISAGFLEDKPTVDALSARQDLSPEVYAAHAMDWIAEGATMVGGCCEVGPAHIAEIARRLRADGHTLI
ncbi:MAG: homocysteine S-methyltransferase family protein [Oceanicola sp.]|nr:homocysteine S-methyltransferase family protein [Oceanicola sp.]